MDTWRPLGDRGRRCAHDTTLWAEALCRRLPLAQPSPWAGAALQGSASTLPTSPPTLQDALRRLPRLRQDLGGWSWMGLSHFLLSLGRKGKLTRR